MPHPTSEQLQSYAKHQGELAAAHEAATAEARRKQLEAYDALVEGDNSITTQMSAEMSRSSDSSGPPAVPDYPRLDKYGNRIPPAPTKSYLFLGAQLQAQWAEYAKSTNDKMYLVAVVERSLVGIRYSDRERAQLADMETQRYKNLKSALRHAPKSKKHSIEPGYFLSTS